MGLFSKKKKIQVSSVSYNLAGDIKDRAKFLPTVVVSHVFKNDASASMAESITASLLSGPGIRFRAFGRWARSSGYTAFVGQTTGNLIVGSNMDISVVAGQIPHGVGETVNVQTSDKGAADYSYWADQWMLDNYPDDVAGDYEIDFNETTNTIIITFLDGSGRVYMFNPVNFDPYALYIYAGYSLSTGEVVGPVIPGAEIVGPWPPTDGWVYDDEQYFLHGDTFTTNVRTEITFSDGSPGSDTTVPSYEYISWTDTVTSLHQDQYQGEDPLTNEIWSNRVHQHNKKIGYKAIHPVTTTDVEEVSPGVFKTTKVTTSAEVLEYQYSYVQEDQRVTHSSWSRMHVMIYKKDSGNAVLDALFDTTISSGAYLPFIPMRLNNNFLTGTIKDRNKKAYKKALGADYQKLEDTIRANPSIGDIDHAYILFGVSLNTKEESARKYLFKYFEASILAGAGSPLGFLAWQTQWNTANEARERWTDWKAAQLDPSSPLYGTPQPPQIPYPLAPASGVRLTSPTMNLNLHTHWKAASKITGSGLGKPGARQGECWITVGATQDYEEIVYSAGIVDRIPSPSGFLTVYWQTKADEYEAIGLWGLRFTNIIYKGKGVDIDGVDAMNDPDESGFIFPLNEEIYRRMSILDATQMANSCAYMVFNCYKVVKQKWYQTKLFKIILIIAVIVITVLTWGGGAASAGILGTASSVGAALGFAGTVAIIVGTVANAIAAVLLSQIIMMTSTAIFGEEVGAIVGAIASVAAVSVGTSMANGGGVAAGFNNLSSAESLMQLTVAAGKGISGYLNSQIGDVQEKTKRLFEEYEVKSSEIAKAWELNLGGGKAYIEPMDMTDAFRPTHETYIAENSTMFLGRTLMTGTDIAQTTHSMLTNFASITVSTQLQM